MNSFERAREFAKKYIDPVAKQLDEEAKFPKEIFDKLGEEGFFLEKCSFLFCFMLFVRSIALYFNKIEIIIKLVG